VVVYEQKTNFTIGMAGIECEIQVKTTMFSRVIPCDPSVKTTRTESHQTCSQEVNRGIGVGRRVGQRGVWNI
jgi:hypothetical protein